MNTLVALPIVAALPVAAPSMPVVAAPQGSLDAELVQPRMIYRRPIKP